MPPAKYTIRVTTNARKEAVTRIDATSFRVSVCAPPVDGKANERVIEVLAKFFGKRKSAFTILRGATSKVKLVEVA